MSLTQELRAQLVWPRFEWLFDARVHRMLWLLAAVAWCFVPLVFERAWSWSLGLHRPSGYAPDPDKLHLGWLLGSVGMIFLAATQLAYPHWAYRLLLAVVGTFWLWSSWVLGRLLGYEDYPPGELEILWAACEVAFICAICGVLNRAWANRVEWAGVLPPLIDSNLWGPSIRVLQLGVPLLATLACFRLMQFKLWRPWPYLYQHTVNIVGSDWRLLIVLASLAGIALLCSSYFYWRVLAGRDRTRKGQFSIGQILLWTLAVALLLGPFRFMVDYFRSFEWRDSPGVLLIALNSAAATVACWHIQFRGWRQARWPLGMAAAAVIGISLLDMWLGGSNRIGYSIASFLRESTRLLWEGGWLAPVSLIHGIGMLLFLRLGGLAWQRSEKAQPAIAHSMLRQALQRMVSLGIRVRKWADAVAETI